MASKKPEDYQGSDLKELYDKISNREPFSFDLENSALYRQYRDAYQRLGSQAMEDTMGRAAGLTGGYGSTYSQTAGQQAYNAWLQELNDKVPEIYNRARERYDRETEGLQSLYQLERDKEATAYNRWQDEYNRWLREYQLEQEAAARAQSQANWQAEQDQNQARWEAEQALQREKFEYQKARDAQKASASGSAGGSRASGSKSAGGGASGDSGGGEAPSAVYSGGVTEAELQSMAESYREKGLNLEGQALEAWLRALGVTGTAAQRFREIVALTRR
ncbi:MAG: hypothetical protein MR473_03375 [Clostridiales bacterium]|nr:hypothetical protein [Clostridiales bacterium]